MIFGAMMEIIWQVHHSTFCDLVKLKKVIRKVNLDFWNYILKREEILEQSGSEPYVTPLIFGLKKILISHLEKFVWHSQHDFMCWCFDFVSFPFFIFLLSKHTHQKTPYSHHNHDHTIQITWINHTTISMINNTILWKWSHSIMTRWCLKNISTHHLIVFKKVW